MAITLPSAGAIARQWRKISQNDQVILSLCAVATGLAAGYGAIGFRWLIGAVQHLFYGFGSENVATLAAGLPWWQILLGPAVGGLLVGLFLKYLMPGGQPQGVAQVIEAASLRGGRMTLKEGIGATVVSAASLGVGASAGREGPVVHLGATLSSWVAQRLHLNRSMTLTLLGCGVAAAVAASFNAPIAGVFFALEVVVGHYALSAFAPIVIASVVGTIVTRIHIGDFPAFILPEYALASFWEFPGFAILGVVCAAVAMIFMRSVRFTEDMVARVKAPLWLKPAAGGLAVGAVAVAFPQVLGVGYEATDSALKEAYVLWFLLALIVAKTAATAVSLGCRFGGGVFSPSLFLGAMTGGAYGLIAAQVFPDLAAGYGLYAIVGMGGVAAAVLGAPISTILIVFEMTGDYKVTVAVMLAVAVASILTQRLMTRSFFLWQLERRGVSLAGGRERQLLQSSRVRDLMTEDFQLIKQDTRLRGIRNRLQTAPHGDFFVVDEEDRLIGTLSFADVRPVAFEPGVEDLIIAYDLARLHSLVLEADSNLEEALRTLGESSATRVPVVEDLKSRRVVGVARYRDLLRAHNRILMQARAEERGEA
jgi:CIC family chloride channel protein